MSIGKFNPTTMCDVLEWRADRHPERIAYTFSEDGENEDGSLTFGQLRDRAFMIGGWLRNFACDDARVLLVLPSGLDYIASFMGCLYSGVVAIPTYPPSPARLRDDTSRFRAVIRDARPNLALTTPRILQSLHSAMECAPELLAIRWQTVEGAGLASEPWRPKRFSDDKIAFLQYTSGSTSNPKGVIVSHANLIHNERGIQKACKHDETSTFVGWLPLYHDMGLIANILQPLFIGSRSILMPPTAFLNNPVRWLRAISRYSGSTSGGPNFGYELCLRRVGEVDSGRLDLSSWSVAFNGAEPVRQGTLERFSERFASSGFRRDAFFPCYGLAECTLMVSGGPKEQTPVLASVDRESLEQGEVKEAREEAQDRRLVGCGRPLSGMQIAIVDAETGTQRQDREIGEIWVSGPSVAQGYWEGGTQSDEAFAGNINGDHQRRWLRTGDLGYLDEGELFIVGRLKDLIIVRGRNFYPNDIELTVEQCSHSLRTSCGAAFAVDCQESEELVIVHEVAREAVHDAAELLDRIRGAVALAHGIQAYVIALVKPGAIPKTTSGKVRRQECRRAFLEKRLPVVAESAIRGSDQSLNGDEADLAARFRALRLDESAANVQAYLLETASRVLRTPVANLTLKAPLAQYGLDSLGSVELITRIESELDVRLRLGVLSGAETLANLVARVVVLLAEPRPVQQGSWISRNSQAADWRELSHGERALWYLHQLDPDSHVYNLSGTFYLGNDTDKAKLFRSMERLIDRHEALRTTFPLENGSPIRRVHACGEANVQEYDAAEWDEQMLWDRIHEAAEQPFTLTERPPLRIHLYSRPNGYMLQVVIHHIIADFWSVEVMIEELASFYMNANETTPAMSPCLPYRAWQQRERELLLDSEGERLGEYWHRQLAAPGVAVPILNLPTEKPVSRPQHQRMKFHSFEIDKVVEARLRELGKQHFVTLFVVFAAALQILLHRWSDMDDVWIACPAACRRDARFHQTVGYLVNTTILRAKFSSPLCFAEFLRELNATVQGLLEHQEYPFDLVVESINPGRNAAQLPLSPVMLVWQQARMSSKPALTGSKAVEGSSVGMNKLEVTPVELRQAGSPANLTLVLHESSAGVDGVFSYHESTFEPRTISSLTQRYLGILQLIAADPTLDISELGFLSPNEDEQEIRAHNPAVFHRSPDLLSDVVGAALDRHPDSVAVTFEDDNVSARELTETASKIARSLRLRLGHVNAVVGICSDRSLELPIFLLAILKAGYAYLPLDPSYPEERLKHMVVQAGASLVICASGQQAHFEGTAEALSLHEILADSRCLDGQKSRCCTSELDVAYVIFTSGSTGAPKGVMNTHAGIVNRLLWMQDRYRCNGSDVVLHKTPFTFDVSVWELFWPLISGARMVVAKPGGHRDPGYLGDLISREEISTVHFVPSMLRAFIEAGQAPKCGSVRRVISSGEALPSDLARQYLDLCSGELHNLYGPTEAAVDVTSWECFGDEIAPMMPIGTPIDNTQIYILDRYMSPRPVGTTGQLYIGGVSLARGYARSPDLTAEKFIPDVFSGNGSRLYATGDLARRRHDGVIEFVGRVDSQVKVRGFRVELGEVEAALRNLPDVSDCAVIAQPERESGSRLVAYVVASGDDVAGACLRRRLAKTLPDYMIPSLFISLDCIPTNDNGKVDYHALPAEAGDEAESELIATPIEQMLRPLWMKTLGLTRCSRHADFFALGGHSLLAVRLLAEIRKSFEIDLSLARLLSGEPTLAAVAETIEDILIESADQHVVNRLLAD